MPSPFSDRLSGTFDLLQAVHDFIHLWETDLIFRGELPNARYQWNGVQNKTKMWATLRSVGASDL